MIPQKRDGWIKRWQCGMVLPAMVLLGHVLTAQSARPVEKPAAPAKEGQRSFHDPTYKISFNYPTKWNFARRDHELSTFHLDARRVARTTLMRAVVSMPENPFPASTFSGAYLYFSVTPHSNDAACARQAGAAAQGTRGGESEVAGISFAHGHDEQTAICIVQRDEVYTTLRHGACYRFDLAINTFCSEASGVKDITEQELDQVRGRLEAILGTMRFDAK